MTRRVLFHVGTPKSGTSYLQDRLALNRAALLGAGVDYVSTRSGDHFEAALDVLGVTWAGAEAEARGEWDALVRTAGESDVDVLVSHEILAGATPEAASRAVASFPDDEVHVVLTVRDLARQVPAEWQENVKHRAVRTYASYLERIQRGYDDPAGDRFWRVQHVPHVLDTWAGALPEGRLHVVSVPQRGGPRSLLWQRYAEAIGVPADVAPTDSSFSNASLGSAETTVLRLLNTRLRPADLEREPYVAWVREGLTRQVLAQDRGSAAITVPPALRGWVDDLSAAWIDDLRARDLRVVGDLDDLLPRWPDDTDPWTDPDQPDATAALDAAVDALAWVVKRGSQAPLPPPVLQPDAEAAPTPASWPVRLARAVRALRHP